MVRALLRDQHAELLHLPLVDVGEGWDNRLFRLGEELAVRLPRRAASAALIKHEQRWLPVLAPRLPLPIPAPHRIGRPGCGYPWFWSVVPWFTGKSATVEPPHDPATTAIALGEFLRALHRPAPVDAPRNAWRGVPLAARASTMREYVERLDGVVDRAPVLALWERALATPAWSGRPVWIHGDLHPGNLLITGGRLSAVIDFGDLTAGDPAVDLAVAWMLLPASTRSLFMRSAREELNPLDDDTWMRARGWALALGVAFVATAGRDEPMNALGRATINAVLNDTAS